MRKDPRGGPGQPDGGGGGPNSSRWYRSPVAILLMVFLVLYALQSMMDSPGNNRVTYSEFKQQAMAGKFERVLIGKEYVRGIPKDASPGTASQQVVYANRVMGDDTLVTELEKAGIQYDAVSESGCSGGEMLWVWLLPLAILVFFWGMLLKRLGSSQGNGSGLMSFGKSRARIYAEKSSGITFDDVGGADEAVEELQEIVQYLKHPEKFRKLGGRIPKGVLLVGPPGTGKTLLARAVAGEAGVPFFNLSASEFVEMFVGVGASRVRDLFQQAQRRAPCIIFIDELDAIGKVRGVSPISGGHEEREQTLNQLLSEMDGFDSRTGLIVMAATNRPEILDKALLRPGRFDRQILVDRPDLKGRQKILKIHSRKVHLAPDVDIKVVAARTSGFAGADLANAINEAALLAARRGREAVHMEDLEEAIERSVAGLEKRSRRLSDIEKRIVAFHESGHAMAASRLAHTDPVHKISIIPRGFGALGYTMQLPLEDRYLMTEDELREKLIVLLGGRSAEEIILDQISTGASDDLHRATEIARHMVRNFGMSAELGAVTFNGGGKSAMSDMENMAEEYGARKYSEDTARDIDAEVRRLVSWAHDEARRIIRENRASVERLANRLLEVEVLDGAELEEILGVAHREPIIPGKNGPEHSPVGPRAPSPQPS